MLAMKLARPGGLDLLAAAEAPIREPDPGEIRVRVRASSLNFHDYAVVTGRIPSGEGRIPMSDGAGEIEAVGDGVDGFAVGDRVISCFFPNWLDGRPELRKLVGVPGDHVDGFATEQVTAPATAFTRAPQGYSFEQAATLPCAALTAWRALMVEARIKPGDVVLTQGTGGVSIFALQLAKAAGCRVLSTSSSNQKLERLKELGADELINYREVPQWGKRALELTGGRGVDVVVEIGGAGTLPQSIEAIRIGGHISLIGVLAGMSGEVPTAKLFTKNGVVSGITVGSRAHQLEMVEALEQNRIEPVIDSTFPLAELADAFRHQESQKHFGKICISI
ncbi:MAG: NAD(P)-dependent alcohol dehydrogenase [Acidobacteria bacterium]|nr:MAG: NAD(P)-dependent alcohol dehydrogenase [Acidobacteriota bacterium]REK09176.1 MAG: NAD(P)-dependent alcohol dehydrogenase [Acidobacteriota bacterium]